MYAMTSIALNRVIYDKKRVTEMNKKNLVENEIGLFLSDPSFIGVIIKTNWRLAI